MDTVDLINTSIRDFAIAKFQRFLQDSGRRPTHFSQDVFGHNKFMRRLVDGVPVKLDTIEAAEKHVNSWYAQQSADGEVRVSSGKSADFTGSGRRAAR